MLKDEPFHWDAWDIQRDAFLTANALSEASIASVDETANGGAVVHAVTRAKGVEIRTGIALRPGSATLDFTADVTGMPSNSSSKWICRSPCKR